MFRKNIIGIDIDDKKTGKELLILLRILNIKGVYRISSSKRGYHFKLKCNPHTKKQSLIIRYMFNDCYGRWLGDVRRLKHAMFNFDILFDIKKNRKAGKWKKI